TIGDDDGAIGMTTERSVGRRVDQISPDSEWIGRHGGRSLASTRAITGGKGGICPQKKDSGSARRRNNKYEKRAATRIALTCLFGQSWGAAVRTFFGQKTNIRAVAAVYDRRTAPSPMSAVIDRRYKSSSACFTVPAFAA